MWPFGDLQPADKSKCHFYVVLRVFCDSAPNTRCIVYLVTLIKEKIPCEANELGTIGTVTTSLNYP